MGVEGEPGVFAAGPVLRSFRFAAIEVAEAFVFVKEAPLGQ